MSELFWPGDRRAGSLFSDRAFVDAMTRVERAWLRVLSDAGLAPEADPDAVPALDVAEVADGTEAGGNPVIPLVRRLRERLPESTALWLHRGLTSQDVLDSALMLCLRDALDQLLDDVRRQVVALAGLADRHRDSVQAGRTLTQHAVPTTFGLTAASWLAGVLDAAGDLQAVRAVLPVQAGGAVGTLSAVTALAGGGADAGRLVEALATELELRPSLPWGVNRRPITRAGDALVGGLDAWGRIANDVLLRSRPEIGELAEPTPGGSSTMPHKQNPVLAVLIRRAAITAPFAAAQLHAAAAAAVDERPDGAWHAEWSPLRTLARTAAIAAAQTADLLSGLRVDAARMRATAEAAGESLLAEARAMGTDPASIDDYLGRAGAIVDQVLDRAAAFKKMAP